MIFCYHNYNFNFLIALDGWDNEYIEFCDRNEIPLLYSAEREGVGLSKNRVLSFFPNYDYYFFIEDDVELLNEDVFFLMINAFLSTNIHNISAYPLYRNFQIINKTKVDDINIIHSMFGSAQVNFFSNKGIALVGGWHTDFASYKRFGHTEHSYRFFHKDVSIAPFNIIEESIRMFKWHEPKTVTYFNPEIVGDTGLALVEEELLKKKLTFFPIMTLCEYFYNNILIDNKQWAKHLPFTNINCGSSTKFLKNPFLRYPIKILFVSERAFEYAIELLRERKLMEFSKEWFLSMFYCRDFKRLLIIMYYPIKLSFNKVLKRK
jgi:hypothetical protein